MRFSLLFLTFFLLLTFVSCEVAIRAGEKVNGDGTSRHLRTLDDESFEHDTQAATGSTTGDWFVEFYAPWCGHCKTLAPVWSELADWVRSEQIPISIAAVDATVSTRTAKRFDIRGFPTLKLISKGIVYDYTGARTLEALQKYVENKEWLAPTGVTSRPCPPELSSMDYVKDYLRETSNNVVMLAWRKTGGVGILIGVGLMVGVLLSMLIFILFLEKQPIVHPVQISAVPNNRATTGGKKENSATSATTPAQQAHETKIPPTNVTAKKAE